MKDFSQTSRQGGRSQFYDLIRTQIRLVRSAACRWSPGRTAAVLFLAAGVCLMAAAQASAAGPGCPDCQYRRPITIDADNLGVNCGGDLSNFPVLVIIEDQDYLKWSDWGGRVGNINGYDIAFTDAGGNPLSHEIEDYYPDEGTLVAWVNVPVLSADPSNDTKIYMYYGDRGVTTATASPEDVWDDNYQGVWHLNQAPSGASGDILDSTANAHHGQSVNMSDGDRIDGRIGKALNFDGLADYVLLGDLEIHNNNQYTVSVWLKGPTGQRDRRFFAEASTSNNRQLFNLGTHNNGASGAADIFIRDNNGQARLQHYKTPGTVFDNTWHRFDFVDNGGNFTCYVDGAPSGSGRYNPKQNKDFNTTSLAAIVRSSVSHHYEGIIDEVRVSDTLRNACWIETEYNNQSNPSGFHVIGDEEEVGEAEGTTYTITATAGANGSISPAGEQEVEEGTYTIFLLIAAENYEVDQVSINGGPFQDHSSAQFEFGPVHADGSIEVKFKETETEPPPDIDNLPPGCSQNVAVDYSGGFDPEDLDIVNVEVNAENHILLNTGNIAIDPNNIVIPFEQQVSVCFLYEGAGDRSCDFGWMLASEGAGGTKQEVYTDIVDEEYGAASGDGVLDVGPGIPGNRFDDRNGDGTVNALDNCEVIGNFEAGTELVFWLNTDQPNKEYRDFDYGDEEDPIYWYTKTAWNQDRYTSNWPDIDVDDYFDSVWHCDYNWGDPFEKTYYLGRPRLKEGKCDEQSSGWMSQDAIDRAGSLFGLNFGIDDESSL